MLLLLLGVSLKRHHAESAELEAVMAEQSEMPHCCRIDLGHRRVENHLGNVAWRRQSGANVAVPGVADRAKN